MAALAPLPPATLVVEARAFLGSLGELLARGDGLAAIDRIYDELDEAMLAGRFDYGDAVLELVDPAVLPLDALLSFLTVASPWRGRLPAYGRLAKGVRLRVAREAPEEVEALLSGLG